MKPGSRKTPVWLGPSIAVIILSFTLGFHVYQRKAAREECQALHEACLQSCEGCSYYYSSGLWGADCRVQCEARR